MRSFWNWALLQTYFICRYFCKHEHSFRCWMDFALLLIIIIIHYIYIALFLALKALYIVRGCLLVHHQCAASTTSVQHPPGWCDGSHSAPDRSPHTSLLVERRQSDEANQYMGMIRRPWWSEANGQIWPGCRGHTSTLFERHPGIFNDHRESGPRFNVSFEGRCFLTVSVPVTWGIRTHTDHRVSIPCWPH